MQKSKIFMTGASGFVGKNILKRLLSEGYYVDCIVRPSTKRYFEKLESDKLRIIEGEFTNLDAWIKEIKEHHVFINCVGIIRETSKSKFQKIHAEIPSQIFKYCDQIGVKKIIQISALGVDDQAQSQYHLSKKAADDVLQNLNMSYAILRPSIIFGVGDMSMSMFRGFAKFPIHVIPGHGGYRLSPIFIDDLVDVVLKSIENTSKGLEKAILNLGGSDTLSLKKIYRQLGNKQALQIAIPEKIIDFFAKLTDFLKVGPISKDEWSMLKRENFCATSDFEHYLRRKPLGVLQAYERMAFFNGPNRVSGLDAILFLLQFTIAFIWLHTGFISAFMIPKSVSLDLLARTGFTGEFASYLLYFVSFFEMLLGLFILVGKMVNLTTIVQLLLILIFTFILSLNIPELWLHPFGPLSKNIPLVGAIIVYWFLKQKD